MAAMFLPAALLPFVLFGYLALKAHYSSLGDELAATHAGVVTFATTDLERDLRRLGPLLDDAGAAIAGGASPRDVLKRLRERSVDVTRVEVVDRNFKPVVVEPPVASAPGVGGPKGGYDTAEFANLARSATLIDDATGGATVMLSRQLPDGRYLLARATLPSIATLQLALRHHPRLYAAAYPWVRPTQPVRFSTGVEFQPTASALRELGTGSDELDVDGETYLVTTRRIEALRADLLLAESTGEAFASARVVLGAYAGLIVLNVVLTLVSVLWTARRVTKPLARVVRAAESFAAGQFETRTKVARVEEVGAVGAAFNKMGEALEVSQLRTRVLYRAINELFALSDLDSVLKVAVELACTQCRAEVAWFVPAATGREIAYADDTVFIGLHGWIWKNHRLATLAAADEAGAWTAVPGDRMFDFTMKSRGQSIGVLRVAYREAPDETMESVLHAMMALVESAIVKQEAIRRSAFVRTELEMAEAVQRNIYAENVPKRAGTRLSYQYEPASRLGGDWFALFEAPHEDRLFLIIGDVSGQGLTQGLVTTAVKGALDVVRHLVTAGHTDGHATFGPASILTLLESVVRNVAGSSGLAMTCLAAEFDFVKREVKVCNAGHTFPIHVRPGSVANEVRHLHENQQPMLGHAAETAHKYEDVTYPLAEGDMVVVYSDGLAQARTLKSPVFGRILFRGLRTPRAGSAPLTAETLKSDIMAMFRFYTQAQPIEDDVCFLVVEMRGEGAVKSGAA
jgi:serine phosphatase RsbU (regulator of sigma subunit)/HAMP domain-containing protein